MQRRIAKLSTLAVLATTLACLWLGSCSHAGADGKGPDGKAHVAPLAVFGVQPKAALVLVGSAGSF